jgi:hypothetical protein
MPHRRVVVAGGVIALAMLAVPGRGRAQGGDGDAPPPDMPGMHDSMSGALGDSPHMRMTPLAPPRPGDAARADTIVRALRQSLAVYADYRRALAEGFVIFAPRVPQHVYHFTRRFGAFARTFHFDPSRPTSLLYERTGDTTFRLVGAMYTAPRTASLADLDARIPLSVVQWHEHVNLCIPRERRSLARWGARDAAGQPLFGVHGAITTEAGCRAAGGRFLPQIFGWMVHVYPFATDTANVWGRGEGQHM